MAIFVSYSRLDEDAVKALARGLEAARRDVWFDDDLGGGEVWWVKILESIRQAEVVVFALSDNALRSKPCRAELDYALALDRTIVPIKVGPVANFRANPLSELQTIEFRENDAHAAFEIIAAVDEASRRYRPLPSVLPPEPQIPFAYLRSLTAQIDTDGLSPQAQLDAVDQLRKAFREETDVSVHDDIVAILLSLRAKKWATNETVGEVDALMTWVESRRRVAAASPAAPPVGASSGEDESEAQQDRAEAVERQRRETFAQNMADALKRQQGSAPPEAGSPRAGSPGAGSARAGSPGAGSDGAGSPGPGSADADRGWRPTGPLGSHSGSTGSAESAATGSATGAAATHDARARFPGVQPISRAPSSSPASSGPPSPPAPTTSAPRWQGVSSASPALAGPVPARPAPRPGGAPATRTGSSPRPYWGLSIPSLLFLPVGLVALYFSVQVGRRLLRGDQAGARRASAYALVWGIVGVALVTVLLLAALGS